MLHLSSEGNFVHSFAGCPRIFVCPHTGYWAGPFLVPFVRMRIVLGLASSNTVWTQGKIGPHRSLLEYFYLLIKFFKAFKLISNLENKNWTIQFDKIFRVISIILLWLPSSLLVDSRVFFQRKTCFASCEATRSTLRLLQDNKPWIHKKKYQNLPKNIERKLWNFI